jgi:hypothetical protein
MNGDKLFPLPIHGLLIMYLYANISISGIPCRNNFTLFPSKQAKKFGGTSITLRCFHYFRSLFSDQSHKSEYAIRFFPLDLNGNNGLNHANMLFHQDRLFS